MTPNTIDAYLETKILSADPIELVRIMYRAAVGAVESARRHLALREIPERSAAIAKSLEILVEFSASLDHERSPEMSTRLAQLYDYMGTRLLEANAQQSDAPLAEVNRLLSTLSEAWEQMKVSSKSELEPPGRGWSF